MNLGLGFPESVSNVKSSTFFGKSQAGRSFPLLAYALLIGVFLLLIVQTIRLQLIFGPSYRVLSEQNRIKTKIIHAPRGTMYDRNGLPLVHNIPGYREKRSNCSEESSCTVMIPRDEVLRRQAKGEHIDNLEVDSLRQYTKPEVFAHILGFLSQITKEELEDPNFEGYGLRGGDLRGRGGVEEQYEEVLRGADGRELIETDAKGREVRVLGRVEGVAGRDITLAIDSKLAEAAYKAMGGKTGAVIVSDPASGEILVLLSTPSFDANLFTMGQTYRPNNGAKEHTVEAILADDTNRPLFNRAISGTYPPGSTFKIVTAAAALAAGAINKETIIEDTGIIHVGAFSFANWFFTQYGKTEGSVDIVKALRRSNDIFFYKAAEATGIDAIADMAGQFGLGKKLGIDMPNEMAGLFPSQTWKKEVLGEGWYLGDTYHIGIGQGYLLTTPLQVNVWTNVIANNGILCQPTVMKIGKCTVKNEKFLQQETIDLIREGMRQACDTGGTGWPLFKFRIKNSELRIDNTNFFTPSEATESGEVTEWVHIPVACKTGTAEFGDPKNRTHAWFTAYAPIADPQLVVTVLVEGGGEGSSIAGPIAKKIFEEWFTR